MRRPPLTRCRDSKSSSCWWPTPTPATWATRPECHILKKIAQKALGLPSCLRGAGVVDQSWDLHGEHLAGPRLQAHGDRSHADSSGRTQPPSRVLLGSQEGWQGWWVMHK